MNHLFDRLQAGISDDTLTIATEPLAAWSYCIRSLANRAGELGFSRPNKKFMILDAGGKNTIFCILFINSRRTEYIFA